MRYHISLFALACVACGNDHEEPITWYETVGPMLAEHCVSCHRQGGVAPFALTDYATAKDNAQRMVAAVEAGQMPPFGVRMDSDCAPQFRWRDDPRLSGHERWLLQEWIDRDYPIGTEIPIPDPPTVRLANITTTLQPIQGWTVAGADDQFICYLLDPGNLDDTWMTGLQVRPGVPEVVHHVIVAEIGPGPEQDQLVSRVGIGLPFDCGLNTVSNLGVYVWTPGMQPLEMRDGVAVPVPVGAKLGLQFHYHSHGVTEADVTSVDLTLTTQRPEKMYGVALIGNAPAAPNLLPGPDDNGGPEFRIPANASDHIERMEFTLSDGLRVATIGPHMHLLGTRLEAWHRSETAGDECLFDGNWNFDWQRYYAYDVPLDDLPTIPAGDPLDITCTYDNTLWNPFMSRWLKDAGVPSPTDVLLGQRTIDEMCLLIVGGVVDLPPAQDMKAMLHSLTTATAAHRVE